MCICVTERIYFELAVTNLNRFRMPAIVKHKIPLVNSMGNGEGRVCQQSLALILELKKHGCVPPKVTCALLYYTVRCTALQGHHSLPVLEQMSVCYVIYGIAFLGPFPSNPVQPVNRRISLIDSQQNWRLPFHDTDIIVNLCHLIIGNSSHSK